MITIVDYGAGNIKSIQNMLKKIGVPCSISSNESVLLDAEKLILPGVGHFDHGMCNLKASGLVDVLNQKVIHEKTPLLGICLGAQLLGIKSEEGEEKGLGWIDMEVVKFDRTKIDQKFKIPHMSWNFIEVKKESKLLKGLPDNPRFYFVHAYHMKALHQSDVLASTHYGYEFVSAVERGNIFGVQFHPEKSHKFGMQVLANFSSLE